MAALQIVAPDLHLLAGKVIEGEVEMDANFALEDYEVAAGYVLSCQSFPVSDKVVLDFDQL